MATTVDGLGGILKKRRITRACDKCHRGGVKCTPSPVVGLCHPCAAFGLTCTYNRPAKRRGPTARNRQSNDRACESSSVEAEASGSRRDGWRYEEIVGDDVIQHIAEGYHRIVYPMQPIVHWPSFSRDLERQKYKTDRAFFVITMAICAITTARLRDGAHLPNSPIFPYPKQYPTSEDFYEACVGAIPKDLSEANDFNYKRAKALLAIVCINYGKVKGLLTHLGDYLTLSSNDGFHNEARWPPNLKEYEIQERRRLFWSTYALDVYSAITWGGVIRHRESQTTVLYPAEVYDDEDITEDGLNLRPTRSRRVSFFTGWNFVTDLYRILEHAVEDLRARRLFSDHNPSKAVTSLLSRPTGPSSSEILELVNNLYNELPGDFKGAKEMTGNLEEDRHGFQAANIIITMQTVKMLVVGVEESTVEQRCAIAGELLDALSTIPTAYIHATSSPTLHHLAGVGHLLGEVIQSPLSQWNYLRVRTVLLAMADLLTGLESALSFTPGIAAKLRAHVSRIDDYMTTAARERSAKSEPYPSVVTDEIWSDEVAQAEASIPAPVLHQSLADYQTDTSLPNTETDAFRIQQDWMPNATGSSDVQYQLPDDLLLDWPFDFGQGDAFDFLGNNWHGMGLGLGLPGGTDGIGETAEGLIDISGSNTIGADHTLSLS